MSNLRELPVMLSLQSFAERMGINAPVSNNQKELKWSKPFEAKKFSEDDLEAIKEVWIDTLRGTSEDGSAYSHRYVFINYDGTVVKVLADKVLDKVEDKTCLDPSRTAIFKRKFLQNEEKVITRCAGQPVEGKKHTWCVESIF